MTTGALDPLSLAAGFGLAVVGLVAGFLVITTYNDVVGLRLRIEKAWSNIDVLLHQRHDQLPALVDAVRGQLAFEQEVVEEVARRRAGYLPDAPVPVQAATSSATSAAVRSLFAVVERYPELRSQENVLALQRSIERLEAMLAARRELYNDQVFRYNTRIAQIPALLLAGLLGWRRRDFFDADPRVENPPPADLAV